ncbi:hypothetical protein ABB10_24860 [Bacillus thuringiensis]|nr:hypothetical protein [Bacillus thuringiensis]MBG9668574.1 hypothetical protein [Bacillus thuringiensis]MBH0355313.1 hypothetical protein [Bacillus thuringiensis]
MQFSIKISYLTHKQKRNRYVQFELYPESWTLKKSPMIRVFCVFLSKKLVIMEPTIEMRYGE